MGHRGGTDGTSEHEGSLRMKTELLIQMVSSSDVQVVVGLTHQETAP